jgi:hypothetical protein
MPAFDELMDRSLQNCGLGNQISQSGHKHSYKDTSKVVGLPIGPTIRHPEAMP